MAVYNVVKTIRVDDRNFLIEWKYKDFLRIGHEFQGRFVVKLECVEHLGADYVRITVDQDEKSKNTTI